MSFDENPDDDDSYMECAREISELQAELSAIRSQAQKDNMRAELCDTYAQWLVDIGKIVGCIILGCALGVRLRTLKRSARRCLHRLQRLSNWKFRRGYHSEY